jgi:hypothetical protein
MNGDGRRSVGDVNAAWISTERHGSRCGTQGIAESHPAHDRANFGVHHQPLGCCTRRKIAHRNKRGLDAIFNACRVRQVEMRRCSLENRSA